MGDIEKEKKDEMQRFLRESGLFPEAGAKSAPCERIGEWELLPNGMWLREIDVNDECFRLEYVSTSKAEAEAIAASLQAMPTELGIARDRLARVSAAVEGLFTNDHSEVAETVLELVRAAREVESLFERDIRSQDAARNFDNWEKKSRFGRSRVKKDPVAAEKAAAKAGARDLWEERRAGRQPKLRTVEQFAMEVMRRWPVLESAKVIARWSAEWTKAAQAGRK